MNFFTNQDKEIKKLQVEFRIKFGLWFGAFWGLAIFAAILIFGVIIIREIVFLSFEVILCFIGFGFGFLVGCFYLYKFMFDQYGPDEK